MKRLWNVFLLYYKISYLRAERERERERERESIRITSICKMQSTEITR